MTNRTFLKTTGARYTLLGALSQHWLQCHGKSNTWKDWKEISEKTVDMPGVRSVRRQTISAITGSTTMCLSPIIQTGSIKQSTQGPPNYPSPAKLSPHNAGSCEQTINEFPSLLPVNHPKKITQGCWNNPARVSVAKVVKPNSQIHATRKYNPQDSYAFQPTNRTQILPAVARCPSLTETSRQNAFPSLVGLNPVKKLQGSWMHGSNAVKSCRPAY